MEKIEECIAANEQFDFLSAWSWQTAITKS